MGGEARASGEGGRDVRLHALVDTMRAFAEATTDYPVLLETVATSLARLIGDACVIVLRSPDGESLCAEATASADPASDALLREVFARHHLAIRDAGVLARVVETGVPVLLPSIEPRTFAAQVAPQYAQAAVDLGIHSALSVPLQVRGKNIGGLALFRFRKESAPFDHDDVAFASGLADHAALAISNATLLEEKKTFAALVQNSTDFIAMAGFDGQVLFVNFAGRRLVGLSPDQDVRELALSDFHTDEGLARGPVIREHGSWHGEGVLRHFQSGLLIPMQVSSFLVRDASGKAICFATVQRDMREKSHLEAQLRQAQKLEAVGRLAGGVAHDFNNLLTVILSYTSLLGRALPSDSPVRGDVEEIAMAGERAATLTRQLLAFSRQQVLEPTVIDLSAVVRGMESIARTLITEDIELVFELDEGAGRIEADESQIGQVIANLIVNARDAMPDGGRLTLATKHVVLDAEGATRIGTAPGHYAVLVTADTGAGIDEATKPHLFEPFFTTKPKGKGTGLGLPTILGIVKQSGGQIVLESEPGKGAVFEAYFPRVELPLTVPAAPPAPVSHVSGGKERILLVEDEPQVRVLMRNVLRRAGYDVIDAPDPTEALVADARCGGDIPLLVTDVVLPGMSGRDLAARFLERRPAAKVLYVSGYTEDIIGREGVLEPGVELLRKPITPDQLLLRVRSVLDA